MKILDGYPKRQRRNVKAEEAVLGALRTGIKTTSELVAMTGLTDASVRNVVKHLVQDHVVVKGKKKSRGGSYTYWLNNHVT